MTRWTLYGFTPPHRGQRLVIGSNELLRRSPTTVLTRSCPSGFASAELPLDTFASELNARLGEHARDAVAWAFETPRPRAKNPTNPEPTRRRKTSPDREETGSDRARKFAHNDRHADPEARERINHGHDRPRRRRQLEPPPDRVTLRPRCTSMKFEAELMTVQDVSRYLRVPVGTLRNWRVTGDGPPAARIGRHVRYRQADVEAWVSEPVRLDVAQRAHEG
jgi:excisionase family DNA binding protein